MVLICVAAMVAVIVASLGWDPWQRRSQLDQLDAFRADGNIGEARELAKRFATSWGSEHVRAAIQDGRGPFEARVVLAATGHHRDLLGRLLATAGATPTQLAEAAAALLGDWPDNPANAPPLPASITDWVTNPATDPALSTQATRLLVAAASDGAATALLQVANDPQMSDARAIEAVIGLCALSGRGSSVGRALESLRGPHRAAILAAPNALEAVRLHAAPTDTAQVFDLLGAADTQTLAMAALAGPRFELPASVAGRVDFAAQLARFLAPDSKPHVLSGALMVVKRQRLVEAHATLCALLPRLAAEPPPGHDPQGLAELFGRVLIQLQTPRQITLSDTLVAGLAKALATPAARPLAAAALGEISDANIAALRPALDALATHSTDGACRKALARLVSQVYKRPDVVTAAERLTWAAIIAQDSKRRTRYDAMRTWMDANRSDTSARRDNAFLATAKAELSTYRDEIRGWLESKDPPPIGLTADALSDLSLNIQLMLKSVLSSSGKL